MKLSKSLCKTMNKLFPLPAHPFNLQNEGKLSYSEWQFLRGNETIKFYLEEVDIDDMLKDKIILDVGCGAGGKTLYYASMGAKKVYGIDVVEKYKDESNKLASKKGLNDKFEFVLSDAANVPFEDEFFDCIIMNDAMEHVDNPTEVLKECHRVLKKGSRIYLNFPPYYHPYGAHLSDVIGFPWIHMFFGEETLVSVYKDLVKKHEDGPERIKFRISKDKNGKEYFSYINKMTIKRFNKILKETKFNIHSYKEVPLRNFLKPLAVVPEIKEMFVKMVVVILEK